MNRSPFSGRHEARRALSAAGRLRRLRRTGNRLAVGDAVPWKLRFLAMLVIIQAKTGISAPSPRRHPSCASTSTATSPIFSPCALKHLAHRCEKRRAKSVRFDRPPGLQEGGRGGRALVVKIDADEATQCRAVEQRVLAGLVGASRISSAPSRSGRLFPIDRYGLLRRLSVGELKRQLHSL